MSNIIDRDRKSGPGPIAWLLTVGLIVVVFVFILRRSETPPVKAESVGTTPTPAAIEESVVAPVEEPAPNVNDNTATNTPPAETLEVEDVIGPKARLVSGVNLDKTLASLEKRIAEERVKVRAGRPTPFNYEKDGGIKL